MTGKNNINNFESTNKVKKIESKKSVKVKKSIKGGGVHNNDDEEESSNTENDYNKITNKKTKYSEIATKYPSMTPEKHAEMLSNVRREEKIKKHGDMIYKYFVEGTLPYFTPTQYNKIMKYLINTYKSFDKFDEINEIIYPVLFENHNYMLNQSELKKNNDELETINNTTNEYIQKKNLEIETIYAEIEHFKTLQDIKSKQINYKIESINIKLKKLFESKYFIREIHN
jgi:hypothetical protein